MPEGAGSQPQRPPPGKGEAHHDELLGRSADIISLTGTQANGQPAVRESTLGKFTRLHWGRKGTACGRDRAGGIELLLRADLFPRSEWHHRYDVGARSPLRGRLGGVRFRSKSRNYDYAFFSGYACSAPKVYR